MNSIVDVLKALSDETRLRIVNLLYEKELCVCDITETLSITQTKASRHLGVLKNAGVVTDRKSAQWVYYSIPDSMKTNFLNSLIKEILPQIVPFNTDLKGLEEWLIVKKQRC